MPELARDGARLVYDVAGAGEPAIVFVHGWTSDRTYFEPQAEYFSKTHRCVSVDLRGHGESDAPEQDYTIEVFADDVAAVCDELGVRDAALVGHSMGGAIVLAMSVRRPDLARATVMLDPALLFPPESEALIVQLAQIFGSPEGLGTLRQFFSDRFFQPCSDPALKERLADRALKTPQHVIASAFSNLPRFDGAAALRQCTKPLLYVGAEPAITDLAHLRELSPGVMVARTAGSGHFHQLEVPEQINAMIERFLAVAG